MNEVGDIAQEQSDNGCLCCRGDFRVIDTASLSLAPPPVSSVDVIWVDLGGVQGAGGSLHLEADGLESNPVLCTRHNAARKEFVELMHSERASRRTRRFVQSLPFFTVSSRTHHHPIRRSSNNASQPPATSGKMTDQHPSCTMFDPVHCRFILDMFAETYTGVVSERFLTALRSIFTVCQALQDLVCLPIMSSSFIFSSSDRDPNGWLLHSYLYLQLSSFRWIAPSMVAGGSLLLEKVELLAIMKLSRMPGRSTVV